jgi:Tol biopolymer transport system component
MKKTTISLAILTVLFCSATNMQAQYFGRNKPKYEQFDFKVLQTPHYQIYHYLNNPELERALANQAEHWYTLHQAVLADTFAERNPLMFYSDHADFQQTNAIGGEISVGTGGVTEALKNRVILPIAMSNEQTKHVLGHELVHAFQYNMVLNGDSTSMRNLANLPLWMVEGLAEYLSIGRTDANTALWMRDAVLNDQVPTLRQLDNPQYFPYRWGQTFWAFVTGLKGDDIIQPLFMATARDGFEVACQQVLGMKEKELSKLWVSAIKDYYGQYLGDKKERFVGRQLIGKDGAKEGRLNIAPVLSPNGKYVAFLSERDIFGIDLFIADAVTGKTIRKIHSSTRDAHLDDLNFIESAGTWSPDSREIAFVAVNEGNNVLVIKDLGGKRKETFPIPGVPAFSNPTWSPDGQRIVVAGLVNGQVDLFQIQLSNKKVTQLTNDRYSEMHPAWSADGSQLVFSTDQLAFDNGAAKWTFNLAIRDMASERTTVTNFFYGADNLNPVWDNEGNILFLSDRDGFRNLYRYETATGKLFQLTDLLTGISGITPYAPALSASTKETRDRIVFTHYFKGGYKVYRAKSDDFINKEVAADAVDLKPAMLIKTNRMAPDYVSSNLEQLTKLPSLPDTSLVQVPFKSNFKLDYIAGSGGVGVGLGNNFGGPVSGIGGGIDFIFGDVTGDHQLFTSAFLNGEILDAGLSTVYLNRKNRFGWGVGLSHLPFQSGRYGYVGLDTLPVDDSPPFEFQHYIFDQIRTFENKLSLFAEFPFSKTLRVEGSGSFAFYNNRIDRNHLYYDDFGNLIYQDRKKISKQEAGLTNLFDGKLGTASIGLVGDNSHFGLASPSAGHRFRLSAERLFGDINLYNVIADARKYVFVKPFTFAVRAMHHGRYGADANAFFDYFLGAPWFMRGYGYNESFEILKQNGRSVEDLFGSKMLIGNAEIRVPFTGPEQLALIKSRALFTELSVFADGGYTWDVFEQQADSDLRSFDFRPLFSAGVSMRINLFGAMILEPYYAWPLLKGASGTFGLNIVPGW